MSNFHYHPFPKFPYQGNFYLREISMSKEISNIISSGHRASLVGYPYPSLIPRILWKKKESEKLNLVPLHRKVF